MYFYIVYSIGEVLMREPLQWTALLTLSYEKNRDSRKSINIHNFLMYKIWDRKQYVTKCNLQILSIESLMSIILLTTGFECQWQPILKKFSIIPSQFRFVDDRFNSSRRRSWLNCMLIEINYEYLIYGRRKYFMDHSTKLVVSDCLI